jgi:hypothetical protein
MTFARPLLYLLLMACIATAAFAAGDGSNSQSSPGSLPNQTADAALFANPPQSVPASSGLFFLKGNPRLSLSSPTVPPTSAILNSAVLNNDECYTMRMYKVKRKEHFADGESGLRGYSTCELASNYQVRSAIAHVQTAQGKDSRNDEPQK